MGERGAEPGPRGSRSPESRLSPGDTLRLLARLYLQQRCLWDQRHSAYIDKEARQMAVEWILKKGEAGGGQTCKHAFLKLRREYRRFLTRAVWLSPAEVAVMLSRAPAWLRDLEAGTGTAWAAAGGAPEDHPVTSPPSPPEEHPAPAAPPPPRPVVLPSRAVSGPAPPTAQVTPVQQADVAYDDFPLLPLDLLDELIDKWSDPDSTPAPVPPSPQHECPLVVRVDAARGVWRNADGSLLATSAPLPATSPTYWTPPPAPPRLLLLRSSEDPLWSLRPSPARGDTTRPPPLVRVGAYLYRRLWSSPPTYARVVTLAWSEEVVHRALSEPGVLNYVYRDRQPLVLLPPPPHQPHQPHPQHPQLDIT